LKKKQGKKKLDVTRLTQRDDPARPGCKPIDFFFLLKRRRFDFFIKKN
jgi:hypothetical protein